MIALSDVGAASGLALGLSNVYNILGIILIIVNLGILIFNFICRMVDRLHDGHLDSQERADTERELKELTDQIESLSNTLEQSERTRAEQDELNKTKRGDQ